MFPNGFEEVENALNYDILAYYMSLEPFLIEKNIKLYKKNNFME